MSGFSFILVQQLTNRHIVIRGGEPVAVVKVEQPAPGRPKFRVSFANGDVDLTPPGGSYRLHQEPVIERQEASS